MVEKKVIPKRNLELVKILDEKQYGTGGKTLLPFQAKDLSFQEGSPLAGKQIKFAIFNPILRAHVEPLEPGARFVVDYEERTRDEPNYPPDRTIVQIYDDQGQPISKSKGGGGYGKSPEIVRLEHELDLELERVKRRSIEGQTAVAQVGTILTCPTPVPGEDLGIDEEGWKRILGKYWKAVEMALDNYLEPPKPKAKTAEPTPKPVQKAQNDQHDPETAAAVTTLEPPAADDILKDVGDLLTRCKNYGVSRAKAFEIWGITSPTEIADLNEAWGKVWNKLLEEKGTAKTEPEKLFD